MSSIGASFVHLRIGSPPAFLSIPLKSLQFCIQNFSNLIIGSNLNLMIFLSQNVGEDVMMGSLMSSIGASFVHLRIGSLPAFLPIPLHSLQLGLLKRDQEWLRELSWDQSWKNFIGQTTNSNLITSKLISQHYTEPEDMYQLHSLSQRVMHKICCCA